MAGKISNTEKEVGSNALNFPTTIIQTCIMNIFLFNTNGVFVSVSKLLESGDVFFCVYAV